LFGYALVLLGCLLAAVWLEPALHVGVFRQWRRLLVAVLPVAAVFVAWDVAATHAGQWWFDFQQTLGVRLAGLPLEEFFFFLVVPVCSILGYEAVRRVLARGQR
jgi:lycopene cyclase domain-containing protein